MQIYHFWCEIHAQFMQNSWFIPSRTQRESSLSAAVSCSGGASSNRRRPSVLPGCDARAWQRTRRRSHLLAPKSSDFDPRIFILFYCIIFLLYISKTYRGTCRLSNRSVSAQKRVRIRIKTAWKCIKTHEKRHLAWLSGRVWWARRGPRPKVHHFKYKIHQFSTRFIIFKCKFTSTSSSTSATGELSSDQNPSRVSPGRPKIIIFHRKNLPFPVQNLRLYMKTHRRYSEEYSRSHLRSSFEIYQAPACIY